MHTHPSHTHIPQTHLVHTYNSYTPTESPHTLSYFRHSRRLTPPRRTSVTCSITKQYLCLGQRAGGGVMAKPQHCDTKHLNASQLRQQARFLFELFYEFYWLLLATTFECFKATLAMLQRQMLIALPNPSSPSPLLLLLLFPLFLS